MFTQTRPALRCDRCGHHHMYHATAGCLVEHCVCAWYIGELPEPSEAAACPHEVQIDVDPTLCVYCGKKVPKRS